MKRIHLLLFSCLMIIFARAQEKTGENKLVYRAAATKWHDLMHTKLEIKPDYDKSWLYGNAWITVRPHIKTTDSLLLDARGMDIHAVSLQKNNILKTLPYDYDGLVLKIHLDRPYASHESYTVFIDYTAKPNELKAGGSMAITNAKGLYFINPKGTEKNKPTQIWTQGETESNSAWFPTIDKPNQKTTEEILLTVPSKYVTLSNGKMVSSKENGNGTRTDYWKMDLPHAPYLFFFGVGEYAIVKDHYKDKEVNYYVEKEYESVARRIYGNTPEMMAFYSRILGVDFPWIKYDQITGRDYVSGAMENTTATLHTSTSQQNERELTEGNRYEHTVAHELFHQWFGDLVTPESWSNITLSESFARYGELIWRNYKYGKEEGDAAAYDQMKLYLSDTTYATRDLVRFYYENREDVFDFVSYDKGGIILNMLRNVVGDSAFYKALNLYLTTYQFKNAEAQNLRLAFEQVTGQDMNWFWNQWYYGSGHPKFNIRYDYDDAVGKATVIIRQVQNTGKIFRIPLAIDVYEGDSKNRYQVTIKNPADTFFFPYKKRPALINVDGDQVILCQKQDNKNLDNFIFQYQHAGLYRDRVEAITYASKHQTDPEARAFLLTALADPFYKVRMETLNMLGYKADSSLSYLQPILQKIATGDSNKIVRSLAIYFLGSFKNEKYKSIFLEATADSSYTVAARSLEALVPLDTLKALELAGKWIHEQPRSRLVTAVQDVLCVYGNENDAASLYDNFEAMDMAQKTISYMRYIKYLAKVKNTIELKSAIDLIVKYRENNRRAIQATNININKALQELADQKTASGFPEQAAYIRNQLL